jgi:outer membrane protein OmpA-like peptidoglycan-associated protein
LSKILFGLLAFILLIVLAVMGSCIYIGYRAKKKADEIRQAYKTNDLDKLAGALGVSEKERRDAGLQPVDKSAAASTPLAFPAWGGTASADASIPLRQGLTVVTAIAGPRGDYESVKRVEKVTNQGVQLLYRADNVPDPSQSPGKEGDKPEPGGSVAVRRMVLSQDLKTAHEYAEMFSTQGPEVERGTTAISVSEAVLEELKSAGETSFTYHASGLKGILGSGLGNLARMAAANGLKDKDAEQLTQLGKNDCTLKRVNDGVRAFPLLLNDAPTTVPAIHAQCAGDDGLADFYLLDNPHNPLALAWKLGPGDTLQVIKINYAQLQETKAAGGQGTPGAGEGAGAAGGEQIEQRLKDTGRAEVYGIYFDFASDKIKPESEAVLREISEALKNNPDWKLQVNGHTDNIGGDEYNLDLSRRRAAAVKQALVARYHVDAERLTPAGFGSSMPKESNATLYGRARNRRVELIRE